MGKIFRNVGGLRLKVKTYINLEDIKAAYIKYKKPGGTTGQFDASVADAEEGIITHECIETDIDEGGWWRFWASVVLPDGRTAAGTSEKVFVWEEGE
jgi:hypothetical protein